MHEVLKLCKKFSPENQAYWDQMEKVRQEVDGYPESKKNGIVSKAVKVNVKVNVKVKQDDVIFPTWSHSE